MKYAWIDGQRHDYPLQALCGRLGVNTSGYADWKECDGSTQWLPDDQLLVLIRSVHAESKQAYGLPRITEELKGGDPVWQAGQYRKLGYWLARKYRRGFRSLMRDHVRAPEPGQAKTWVLQGQNSRGWYGAVALRRLVTSRKGRFTWRSPSENPYIMRDETAAPSSRAMPMSPLL